MRRILLYIASSLDSFIARENGSVDWLDPFNDAGTDYGYEAFYASIDTTLMGHTTYQQVLSFGDFPYKEKKNYVFTRQSKLPPATKHVKFVNQDIASFVHMLQKEQGMDIWLIGGSQLNEAFLNLRLVDELILTLMPVTLGQGIPLFTSNIQQKNFKLENVDSYANGVVQLRYSVR